jgi:hypothetical protein
VASRDEILADMVADTIVWLELVDDETLDPDLAVKLMEGDLARLFELDPADRLWLVDRLRNRAATDPRPDWRLALAELAEDLADA